MYGRYDFQRGFDVDLDIDEGPWNRDELADGLRAICAAVRIDAMVHYDEWPPAEELPQAVWIQLWHYPADGDFAERTEIEVRFNDVSGREYEDCVYAISGELPGLAKEPDILLWFEDQLRLVLNRVGWLKTADRP